MLNLLHVARHQQLHEGPGGLEAFRALDNHLFDVPVIDVPDRALDKIAVLIDQRRRGR